MTRAAIYCRLSEEDRNKKSALEESESIVNQKSLLLEYCRVNRWEVVGVFSDEDMSGADRSRPQFNRMLAACAAGEVDVVLCKTQSRFSRDMEVTEHYIHNKFVEWGVRFIGVLDHADTEDKANKKSRQINGLVNEWYLEDLSENIKKTLRHKKEQGIYTGSFAPYGYRLDENARGKLLIDDAAASVVRQIYQLYLSGMGYVKIAKQLNGSGIPCPSEYKRLCGSRFQTQAGKPTSKIWSESVVRQILTNPVYTGTLVQRKTEKISYKSAKRRRVAEENRIVTPNAHVPVVTAEQWEAVRSRIGGGMRQQKDSGKRHVFAGRIYCGVCGSSMWKMSYQLKDGRYAYLKCKATKCGTGVCTNTTTIRFDAVYHGVEQEIRKALRAYYAPEQVSPDAVFVPQASGEHQAESDIEARILKQNCNIKQLYKDKLDGIIDNEVFCSLYQDIKEDIASLKRQLAAEKEKIPPPRQVEDFIAGFAEGMELDELAVSQLIEKIYIGQPEEGRRQITIFWNI